MILEKDKTNHMPVLFLSQDGSSFDVFRQDVQDCDTYRRIKNCPKTGLVKRLFS